MNEQNKKLLECAAFIKEHCENTNTCRTCIFNKIEIERDEYTNEPINYYRYCELERKTYPCNWHLEHGRLIDADALLKTLNDENVKYDADVNYFICNAPTIVNPTHKESEENK